MDIVERQAGDRDRLVELAGKEKDATQRDRLRAAWMAIDGHITKDIQRTLGRHRNFVQKWAYAYRDGGIEAIAPKSAPGAPCKLTEAQQVAFKRRMLDGPTEADGVCSLRGPSAQKILAEEFGEDYATSSTYKLLHRLNLSCLVPRPQHRKNDPDAMNKWLEGAPG